MVELWKGVACWRWTECDGDGISPSGHSSQKKSPVQLENQRNQQRSGQGKGFRGNSDQFFQVLAGASDPLQHPCASKTAHRTVALESLAPHWLISGWQTRATTDVAVSMVKINDTEAVTRNHALVFKQPAQSCRMGIGSQNPLRNVRNEVSSDFWRSVNRHRGARVSISSSAEPPW